MNLVKLPIPDREIYLNTDKILSIEMFPETGCLQINFGEDGDLSFSLYDDAKNVLQTILSSTYKPHGNTLLQERK